MDDAEIDAICERIVNMPAKDQVAFLLGMLEKVSDERDRLRAVANDATIDATALVAERADLEDEVDRLRAVVDAARELRRLTGRGHGPINEPHEVLFSAVDALDGSAEVTDG